jgi:acetyl/propionyl-CoA carboxylase alpha subunit
MFKKVLVANRGEIAVRIIRACREIGIETVAVYSEADRRALHVRYADEAYLLGPAPSRESYLRADKLIDIARKCGADAVHPGYGFLAEREDFAAACAEAEIAFIGPKPSSIAAMGDKAEARATVIKAGVPVVPGTEGVGNMTDEELLKAAPEIGFPLLIKATAGGGGKGMREVRSLEEMPTLLQSARREAESPVRAARGGIRLRRWERLFGEIARRCPAYRDPDPGRYTGQCDPFGRTRMLPAAASPKIIGRGPLAGPGRGPARDYGECSS